METTFPLPTVFLPSSVSYFPALPQTIFFFFFFFPQFFWRHLHSATDHDLIPETELNPLKSIRPPASHHALNLAGWGSVRQSWSRWNVPLCNLVQSPRGWVHCSSWVISDECYPSTKDRRGSSKNKPLPSPVSCRLIERAYSQSTANLKKAMHTNSRKISLTGILMQSQPI